MTWRELVAVSLYLVAVVTWAIIARHLWAYRQHVRPRSRTLRLVPIAAGLTAVPFLVHLAWPLLPPDIRAARPVVFRLSFELSVLVALAVWRHMLRVLPLPERAPGRGWLITNYGIAAATALLFAWTRLTPRWPDEPPWIDEVMIHLALVVMGVLFVVQAMRIARPGAWGPEHAGELRRWDVVLVARGLATTVLVALLLTALGEHELTHVVSEVGVGLAFALPLAVTMLGVFVPEFLVTNAMLAASAGLLVAYGALLARIAPPFHPVVHLVAVLAVGVLLTAGHSGLRTSIHRLVLRRSARHLAELQAFLHMLSPGLGRDECCRRALAELVRLRQLPGAAILFPDGEAVVAGTFDVRPLLRVWPRGAAADALPARTLGTAELRELPLVLREALIEANVGLGVVPLLSPRRRWGHLFMHTGLLRGTFRDDDLEALEAFVGQLALLLDAADLLARTVAVERALAHAEKLAAIGETAARIAHEIRNPVTAARSLAQQLAREPASPFGEELGLILGELERVERQVAALLRFARRDELRLEAVDLAELVRATADGYRSRLAAAGISLAVEGVPGVVARADREKLRQVLVNVIDNAADALGEVPGDRRLTLAVASRNGTVSVRVADSGRGVTPDQLARLFEPFFSTKATGTGLGLAIVRRTIEAHGGHVSIASTVGEGTTVAIDLPAMEEET